MKKFNKLSAMLMASVITAGTVSSMSAGAMAWISSKEYMDKQIEDAYMIPVGSFSSNADSERIYLSETEHHNVFDYLSIYGARPDRISAELNAEIDDEDLKKAIAEICPQAEYIAITPSENEIYRCISVAGVDFKITPRLAYDNIRKTDLTYEQVLEIYDLLNSMGELQKFEYKQGEVYSGDISLSLTTYCNEDDNLELIKNYIAENNLDWYTDETPIDSHATFSINVEKEISPEECYKIAEQIYNDLGLTPCYDFPTPSSGNIYEGTTIEMHTNIKGDANDDGELRLSDAITILQAIGNPDEYELSPQGSYNADIYGNRDGITAMDAVAVQQKLLGLE